MDHEKVWLTKLFNDHIPGVGNLTLKLLGLPPEQRPWADFMTMELVVVLIIILLFAFLRRQLSVDKPGKLQQTFELIGDFVRSQSEESVGHDGPRYIGFFGTIFIFILFCNLIGIIPGLASPTIIPSVPAGCAIAVFCYYNLAGFREQGVGKYVAHFAGPMPILAPLMVPIELVSHLARPLSLTIRLYANMFAGEQVTLVFLTLTYFGVPALFMGLHVFVSFLQAYIFMLLAMMYVGGAVAHEH